MGWRIITIENPAKLKLHQGSLSIQQDQGTARVPIEDIDTLVLDNYAITMTINLLTELASQGVATILCDRRHLPCSILLPYSQHSRQSKISSAQLNMSEPLRKNIWKQIIVQKIINQASVLRKFNHDDSAQKLLELAHDVRSGDTSNRESVAANLYFTELLEDSTRRKPMWHNSALNYGYSIVRSQIARSIAGHGLIISQGICHHSELNSFNLADDLIEPFRAAVDNYVLSTVYTRHIGETNDISLTDDDRHLILDISNFYVIICSKKTTVHNAIETMVEGYTRTILNNSVSELQLPSLI